MSATDPMLASSMMQTKNWSIEGDCLSVTIDIPFEQMQLQTSSSKVASYISKIYGKETVLNILDTLVHYLRHQEEVITRRTKYDLNKAEERAHILQGLLIALDNIDEVIEIIRQLNHK